MIGVPVSERRPCGKVEDAEDLIEVVVPGCFRTIGLYVLNPHLIPTNHGNMGANSQRRIGAFFIA